MPRYEMVPLTLAHCEAIAPRMRPSDVAEIWAAAHLEPLEALTQGLNLSAESWAGLVDGLPICAFGVAPLSLLGGEGTPWMLGTPEIEAHALPFLRRSWGVVANWRKTWPLLTNHVDARNHTSKRWLQWLGFRLSPAAPWGADGLDFHRFEMRRG